MVYTTFYADCLPEEDHRINGSKWDNNKSVNLITWKTHGITVLEKKWTMKKLNHFYIIATNFNETSIPLTHIGSDYFSLIIVVRVSLVVAKSY